MRHFLSIFPSEFGQLSRLLICFFVTISHHHMIIFHTHLFPSGFRQLSGLLICYVFCFFYNFISSHIHISYLSLSIRISSALWIINLLCFFLSSHNHISHISLSLRISSALQIMVIERRLRERSLIVRGSQGSSWRVTMIARWAFASSSTSSSSSS